MRIKNLAISLAVPIILVSSVFTSSLFAYKRSDSAAKIKSLIVKTTIGGISEMTPKFSPDIFDYKINVNADISLGEIVPTLSDTNNTITIEGKPVQSGNSYAIENLAVGNNIFNIVISGTNATQKYTLTITRENIQPVVDKFLSFSYTDQETGITMPYRLYVPQGYDEIRSKQNYPLVLFLHGGGERGNDNIKQLTGNQGATIWAKPEEQKKHPCFILAPQARDTYEGGFAITRDESNAINLSRVFEFSKDLKVANRILDKVVSEYNVDKNRLYCVGLSQGGLGTWNLNTTYPNKFAAMVPIAGGADPAKVTSLENKPIWAFHAEEDPVIPVSYSRDSISRLQNSKVKPLYTEYPKGTYFNPSAHFSWVPALTNSEMREWLFNQSLSKSSSNFH
jgi:predicted peptidase